MCVFSVCTLVFVLVAYSPAHKRHLAEMLHKNLIVRVTLFYSFTPKVLFDFKWHATHMETF